MALQRYETREELKALLDNEIEGDRREQPENNFLESALKIAIAGDFPTSQMEVYGYGDVTGQYLFLFEHSGKQYPYMPIRKPLNGHNIDLLENAAPLLIDRMRELISKHGKILIVGDEQTCEVFHRHLSSIIGGKYVNPINACGVFYMNLSQRQKVLEENFDAPSGFIIEPVDVNKDGGTIHRMWKYSLGEELTKNRLRYLPSLCARNSAGEIVGWVMADRFGQISNLFVIPEFRGRGLGKALEMSIAKEFERRDLRVFKYVEKSNTSVYEGSLRSPLWTLWTIEDEENNETKKPNMHYFRLFACSWVLRI